MAVPDLESRVAVANHCRITFGSLKTVNNGWLSFTPDGMGIEAHADLRHPETRRIRASGRCLRHPDVLVCRVVGRGKVGDFAAIEIDGSIHARRSERTQRRDDEYAAMGVPLLVLPDDEVAGDGNWRDTVDRFVADAFPEVLK